MHPGVRGGGMPLGGFRRDGRHGRLRRGGRLRRSGLRRSFRSSRLHVGTPARDADRRASRRSIAWSWRIARRSSCSIFRTSAGLVDLGPRLARPGFAGRFLVPPVGLREQALAGSLRAFSRRFPRLVELLTGGLPCLLGVVAGGILELILRLVDGVAQVLAGLLQALAHLLVDLAAGPEGLVQLLAGLVERLLEVLGDDPTLVEGLAHLGRGLVEGLDDLLADGPKVLAQLLAEVPEQPLEMIGHLLVIVVPVLVLILVVIIVGLRLELLADRAVELLDEIIQLVLDLEAATGSGLARGCPGPRSGPGAG